MPFLPANFEFKLVNVDLALRDPGAVERKIAPFLKAKNPAYAAENRNQTAAKVLHDYHVGYLGEFAAKQYLESQGVAVADPDLTVTNGPRNWGPDIGPFQVKTSPYQMDNGRGIGWGWVGQWANENGVGGRDPYLFGKVNTTLMLVCRLTPYPEYRFKIYGFVSAFYARDLWELPIAPKLRKTKRVLREDKLIPITDPLSEFDTLPLAELLI